MNRKYNISEYKDKIDLIRSYFEDVNITTDILAGFSGETEEDFNIAYDFVSKIKFGEMHVFPYSPRPKTKAYNLKNRVDSLTKKFRVNELLKLNEVNALDYRNKFLNKEIDCLVEKVINNVAFGHSSNYLEISFKCNDDIKENALVNVVLTEIGYPVWKGVKK